MSNILKMLWTIRITGPAAILIALFLPLIVKRTGCRHVLLGCVTFALLWFTVLNRSAGNGGVNLRLFWSYELWHDLQYRYEIIENIIAFVPLGVLLKGSFKKLKAWQIVLICCVFSVCIEAAQGIFGLGLCETDDVIDNTLGGLIGVLLYGKGSLLLSVHKQKRRNP